MFNFKKLAITTMLGVALGWGTHVQSAWATFGVPISPCSPCSTSFSIIGSGTGTNYNTFNYALSDAGPLTLVNGTGIVQTYTENSGTSNAVTVDAVSSVYRTTSGTLDFFYQFDVSSVGGGVSTPIISSAGLSPFNSPNSTAYNLNLGVIGTADGSYDFASVGGSNGTGASPLLATACPTCVIVPGSSSAGTTFFGNASNPTTLSINGTGTVFGGNNTPITLNTGNLSPVFFMATNALYYQSGTFNIQGPGFGNNFTAWVPDTPEPTTVILFGSALVLLSFLYIRKKGSSFLI